MHQKESKLPLAPPQHGLGVLLTKLQHVLGPCMCGPMRKSIGHQRSGLWASQREKQWPSRAPFLTHLAGWVDTSPFRSESCCQFANLRIDWSAPRSPNQWSLLWGRNQEPANKLYAGSPMVAAKQCVWPFPLKVIISKIWDQFEVTCSNIVVWKIKYVETKRCTLNKSYGRTSLRQTSLKKISWCMRCFGCAQEWQSSKHQRQELSKQVWVPLHRLSHLTLSRQSAFSGMAPRFLGLPSVAARFRCFLRCACQAPHANGVPSTNDSVLFSP